MALTIFDEDNSDDSEDRWITLGQANGQYYLVVVLPQPERRPGDDPADFRQTANKHAIKQYQGEHHARRL